MSFQARSASVMAALAAILLPWAGGVLVVAHLASEGHHHVKPVVHDTEGVQQVVHGHRHESDSPLHEHTIVVARPATLTARLTVGEAPAAALPPAIASATPARGSFAAPADIAHGPPLIPEASPILRI